MKHTSLNQKKVSLRRVLAQESKRADSATALLGAMVRRHGPQTISNEELSGLLKSKQEFLIEDIDRDSIRLRFADQMLAEAPNEQ